MKSVPIHAGILRFRNKETGFNSIEEDARTQLKHTMSVHFPLRIVSNDDRLSAQKDSENLPSPQYLKVLQLASSKSFSLELIQSLGEISTDIVNQLDKSQGAAPLHYACMNGNLQMVTFLLENGGDVNIWDQHKTVTPLMCAAAYGHLEIVQILLEHDCNVNSGLNNSCEPSTALLWAVRRSHTQVVRYLLDHNASQISQTPYSETPIHAAVISGSPEILEMLVTSGRSTASKADFQMGIDKDTPLHLATSGKYPNALEICKILLERANVKVNLLNARERTSLHNAASSHDTDVLELLLSYRARADAADNEGKTPLFLVIKDTEEALKCMELLIVRGRCSVNHQDKQGNTALHYAAMFGAEGAAEILLLHGADFSIRANCGISALSQLRRKIPNIESLLEKTFDQAVTVKNCHSSSSGTRQECIVEVNFQYVLPSSPSSSSLSLQAFQEEPSDKGKLNRFSRMTNVFKDSEKMNDSKASSWRKETSKVKCLIEEDLPCLLAHPVIHSFLEMKWHKTRSLFLPTLTFKAILIILFSIYVQLPLALNGTLTQESGNNTNTTNDIAEAEKRDDTPIWFKCMYIVIVTMAVLRGFIDLIPILRAPKPQLRTLHPWISLAVLLIICLYMQPQTWSCVHEPLPKAMAALGILLAWIDIWIDMARFPKMGLSIRVFVRVFTNFSAFIMPHFCLLAGFILSFTVLFHENAEFKSVALGITKIIRVMAGDITIAAEGQKVITPENTPEEILSHILLVYIYTAFVLIVSIVLMNLLIGLAVNDIQGIYAGAAVDKLVKQTILLNTCESSFNGIWTKRWISEGLKEKYLNLFPVASTSKILTFQPYDTRDCKLSSDQKKALLDIGNAADKMQSVRDGNEVSNGSSSSKNTRQWRSVVNALRRSSMDADQKVLIENINTLLSNYLNARKPTTTM